MIRWSFYRDSPVSYSPIYNVYCSLFSADGVPSWHLQNTGDWCRGTGLWIAEGSGMYRHCPSDPVNSLRPRQNKHHFADDVFRCNFLNENVWIPIKISLKFVPESRINNIPALVQIMAWRRPGDKPLSEPMMVSLLMHICVTRPQWVNSLWPNDAIWYHNGISKILSTLLSDF